MKKKVKFIFKIIYFSFLILISSCISKGRIEISLVKKSKNSETLNVSVANVQIMNHQVIITGTNLDAVTAFKIQEGANTAELEIESKTSTSIVANTLSNVSFAAGKVFDFILSNANAASTFTVNFSLCDSSLGGKGFDCLVVPNDKDVLSFDAATNKWVPRNVNGLTYKGTFDASPGVDPLGSPLAGDYYLVSIAGTINTVSYLVGDWIVYNQDDLAWQKVSNSKDVLSVFGRTGKISAKEGDYSLTKMSDVDLTTVPPVLDQILKFNGTNWVPGTAASAAAAGTVSAPGYSFNGNTNTGFYSPAVNQIGITNNGVESVRIDSTGKVGVGTTTPTAAFHLLGTTPGSGSAANVLTVVGGTGALNGAGGAISLTGGTGNSTGDGGAFSVAGGAGGVNGKGGAISITGGVGGSTSGMAGGVTIAGGNAPAQTGGSAVTLKGGTYGGGPASSIILGSGGSVTGGSISIATSTGGYPSNAGSISLTTGNGSAGNGTGGNLTMTAGNGDGPGTGGTINISAGAGGSSNVNGSNVIINGGTRGGTGADGNVILSNLLGNVGIKTTTPGSALDVKGTLRLSGSTSGYVGFAPAAAAGSTTYTLPVADGTAGQALTTNASGVLSWATVAGAVSGTSGGIPYYDSATTMASSAQLGQYGLVIGGGAGGAPSTIGTGVAGQYVKSAGVGTPAFSYIVMGDLKDGLGLGGNLFPNNCTAAQTYVYSVISGSFSCANITAAASLSSLTAAAATNTIDNLNFNQFWNWTTATTESLLTMAANALTTGSILNISTSNGTLNSTNGLLNVANTGASTNGVLARFQANSTAGSGVTVLTSGRVGIGTATPAFDVDASGKTIRLDTLSLETAGNIMNLKVNTDGSSQKYLAIGSKWTLHDLFGMNFDGLNSVTFTSILSGSNTGWRAGSISMKHCGASAQCGDMKFEAGGASNQLYLSNDGNVGIGTATPAEKLTVAGNQRLEFPDSGNNSELVWSANGANKASAKISSVGTDVFARKGLAFYTGNYSDWTTAPDERMRIDKNGNVGIGTTSPSEKLHVVGNLRVEGSTDCTLGNGAGGTNCSSDIRLKENIQAIKDPLRKILSLKGVEFDWNEKSNSPGNHAIGVIAQDIEKVFPTAVIQDPTTGYKKVDYAVLVAPIIQAFKEFNKFISELFKTSEDHTRDIALLKTENKILKAENKDIKAENKEIKAKLEKIEKLLEKIK